MAYRVAIVDDSNTDAVYMDELPYRIRENTKKEIIEFNKRLANKNKYTSILLPAEDGITVARKEF